jgi:hypothetical protein
MYLTRDGIEVVVVVVVSRKNGVDYYHYSTPYLMAGGDRR